MKIYTKTGDKGTTSLIGGKRVSKSSLRINVYGTIDELNSFTGFLNSPNIDKQSHSVLTKIQNKLFTIGSNLAMEKKDEKIKIPEITEKDTEFLENEIDLMEKNLEPLKHFILPGGNNSVAMAHICRTVCRRAERLFVELSQIEKVDLEIGNFLNRLADYYFVLSRKIMEDNKIEPLIWEP